MTLERSLGLGLPVKFDHWLKGQTGLKEKLSLTDKQKPNLIFIFPDQMRSDFLGCYGADFIKTPNIDSLANDGIRYEIYIFHPIVPARSGLMTGMDAISNGILVTLHQLDLTKEAGIKTWPETLRDSGYYTSLIGKMHFIHGLIKMGSCIGQQQKTKGG